MYIYVCIYIDRYIYIERERERSSELTHPPPCIAALRPTRRSSSVTPRLVSRRAQTQFPARSQAAVEARPLHDIAITNIVWHVLQ